MFECSNSKLRWCICHLKNKKVFHIVPYTWSFAMVQPLVKNSGWLTVKRHSSLHYKTLTIYGAQNFLLVLDCLTLFPNTFCFVKTLKTIKFVKQLTTDIRALLALDNRLNMRKDLGKWSTYCSSADRESTFYMWEGV